MAEPNDIDRVWDILESHSVGMLTTQFSGGLRARPLDARPDRDAGAIFFVTDVRGHKDDEIAAQPDVCFVVTVPNDNVYLSITGRADGDPRPGQGPANLEEDSTTCGGGRAGRSERPRAHDRAGDGRALGRPVELAGRGLRVRQGENDRREADARREPEEDRGDGLGLRRAAVARRFFQTHQVPTPSAVSAQEAAAKIIAAENAIGANTYCTTSILSPIRNTADRMPARMKVPADR